MTDFFNLESSNIWDYKPKWCQPWSILLTGIILIVGSWFTIHIIMFKEYVESQRKV